MAERGGETGGGGSSQGQMGLEAREAMDRLRRGNEAYLDAMANDGDISQETRRRLSEEGQAPYACIVSCSDSRVVPEHIFMAGLGELFCIRVAGNVIGDTVAASCMYAVEHLRVPLVVVLGHTQCGAVGAALEAKAAGVTVDAADALAPLVSRIVDAIGGEVDPRAASIANTAAAARVLRQLCAPMGIAVRGALYHTESGRVEFLP